MKKRGAKPCVDVHSAQLIRFFSKGVRFYKGVHRLSAPLSPNRLSAIAANWRQAHACR